MTIHEISGLLKGAKVLDIRSGRSAGSVFTLHFGEELVQRVRRNFSFYEGKFVLMCYCSWRLADLNSGMAITGWKEDSGEEGAMMKGLQQLVNERVQEVTFSVFKDVTIVFSGGKVLSYSVTLLSEQILIRIGFLV